MLCFKNAEGQGLDLVISTAVCAVGLILFTMIFFANNKERVPFTQEKVSIKDSLKVVFGNKNLLMVSLTKLTGCGRGVYGTVSLYIAIYLLGSKDLKLALLLPMGIGTAVGTLLVNFVLKKFSTKQTFSTKRANVRMVLHMQATVCSQRLHLHLQRVSVRGFFIHGHSMQYLRTRTLHMRHRAILRLTVCL